MFAENRVCCLSRLSQLALELSPLMGHRAYHQLNPCYASIDVTHQAFLADDSLQGGIRQGEGILVLQRKNFSQGEKFPSFGDLTLFCVVPSAHCV